MVPLASFGTYASGAAAAVSENAARVAAIRRTVCIMVNLLCGCRVAGDTAWRPSRTGALRPAVDPVAAAVRIIDADPPVDRGSVV
jgi:hypothetical protein